MTVPRDDVPSSAITLPDGFTASEHPDLIANRMPDIHALLATTYWAQHRDLPATGLAFAHSNPIVILAPSSDLAAVARLISDHLTFGYLTDVVVAEPWRGIGLGRAIAEWSVNWARARGIARLALTTTDAHGIYYPSGYDAIRDPGVWLEWTERPRYVPEGFTAPPNPYRQPTQS